ncbi:hypothetical protein H000_03674 [Escherichia coli UMEA 3899-1]|nr:hypothetical protein H000_03674 [Escherichia coli UMEA 3899-1]
MFRAFHAAKAAYSKLWSSSAMLFELFRSRIIIFYVMIVFLCV